MERRRTRRSSARSGSAGRPCSLDTRRPAPAHPPRRRWPPSTRQIKASRADQATEGQHKWEAEARQRLSQTAGGGTAEGDGTPGKALPARVAAILKLPPARRNAAQSRSLSDFYLAQLPEMIRMKQAKTRVEKVFAKYRPASTQVMSERIASSRVDDVPTWANTRRRI